MMFGIMRLRIKQCSISLTVPRPLQNRERSEFTQYFPRILSSILTFFFKRLAKSHNVGYELSRAMALKVEGGPPPFSFLQNVV